MDVSHILSWSFGSAACFNETKRHNEIFIDLINGSVDTAEISLSTIEMAYFSSQHNESNIAGDFVGQYFAISIKFLIKHNGKHCLSNTTSKTAVIFELCVCPKGFQQSERRLKRKVLVAR